MIDNVHHCPQMPDDMRILQTCGEVWELKYDDGEPGSIKRTNDPICPHCGAAFMEDSDES